MRVTSIRHIRIPPLAVLQGQIGAKRMTSYILRVPYQVDR
jgi:hypothetical protein